MSYDIIPKAGLGQFAEGIFNKLKPKFNANGVYAKWNDFANSETLPAIGTALSEPWKDVETGLSYDNPWRVNRYGYATLENGEKVFGAWLQNVYTHPFGVQFSHPRAFLRCPDGLAAGSYYFAFGANSGTYVVKDDVVAFTIAEALPSDYRLTITNLDKANTNWRIQIYDAEGKTIVSTITPTFEVPTGATNLGVMNDATRNGNLNSRQEAQYGWNNYEHSAVRQYLTSALGKGLWWTAEDGWDIAPDQLAAKAGYLTGLPEEFLSHLLPVECITYANTVQDAGAKCVTYDKVRLISLEEMYVNPQIEGEGEAHDYWKNLNGTATKWAQGGTYEILKQYAVENHSSAQYVRLRSAYRGSATNTWNIYTSGNVFISNAGYAYRFEPLVFFNLPIRCARQRIDDAVSTILGDFAEKEEKTATANHDEDDLLIVDGNLVKTTGSIAAGETVAIGTNVKKTTVADELAALKSEVTTNKTADDTRTKYLDISLAARSVNKSKYQIGRTFTEPWTDIATGVTYDNTWRVNHYEACEVKGGITIPGMWLQNVYAHPFGVQFSHERAFLRCPNGKSAGSYYFTFGDTIGSNNYVVKDEVVGFTLSSDVPEGGRIAGCYQGPDTAKANWRIYVYDADGKTILETVTPVFTIPDGATDLGTMNANTRNGDLNSIREMCYGWNNYEHSAIRQYLTSDLGVGLWWLPTDEWDIAPNQLATKAGYLTGLSEGFKELLQPVKYTTYANTVQDGGAASATYDKVGLISLEQMYVNPQVSGEGESHEYWKNLNGTETKWPQSTAIEALKQYAVENHSSAQNVRLRSAYRGYALYTWFIYTSGYVSYGYYANYALRFEPLVFI